MKTLVSSFLIFTSIALSNYALARVEYYRDTNLSLRNENLKSELFKLISTNHKALGYKTARTHLFGEIHLEINNRGHFIEDVYCNKTFTRSQGVGEGMIPNSTKINCEHTWPQSKFSQKFSSSLQKGDLHHLYPTDSRSNSMRGNHPFGEVDGGAISSDCDEAKLGGATVSTRFDEVYFEPPAEHKGNVARALFYFSVRYKIAISKTQEDYLKKWHQLDPVDEKERRRNDLVEKFQGNRNPFIDNPRLAKLIQDF